MSPSSKSSSSSPWSPARRLLSLAVFAVVAYLLFAVAKAPQTKGENIFRYHPLFMTLFVTGTLPEVLSTVAALQNKKKMKGISRSQLVDNHQLATFLLQVSGALGFGAIVYAKQTHQKPHLATPHAIIGFACGCALAMEVTIGALLRYVIGFTSNARRPLVTLHGLLSLIISLTSLMGFAGGFLATSYAEKAIPSFTVRAGITAVAPLMIFLAFA